MGPRHVNLADTHTKQAEEHTATQKRVRTGERIEKISALISDRLILKLKAPAIGAFSYLMELTPKQSLGRRGESLACAYLERRDYLIIERNCRLGRREIDIIAKKGERWIFCEIKTRKLSPDSLYENPLTRQQTFILRRAILDYCRARLINPTYASLDLIIIWADEKKRTANLRHYKDVL